MAEILTSDISRIPHDLEQRILDTITTTQAPCPEKPNNNMISWAELVLPPVLLSDSREWMTEALIDYGVPADDIHSTAIRPYFEKVDDRVANGEVHIDNAATSFTSTSIDEIFASMKKSTHMLHFLNMQARPIRPEKTPLRSEDSAKSTPRETPAQTGKVISQHKFNVTVSPLPASSVVLLDRQHRDLVDKEDGVNLFEIERDENGLLVLKEGVDLKYQQSKNGRLARHDMRTDIHFAAPLPGGTPKLRLAYNQFEREQVN